MRFGFAYIPMIISWYGIGMIVASKCTKLEFVAFGVFFETIEYLMNFGYSFVYIQKLIIAYDFTKGNEDKVKEQFKAQLSACLLCGCMLIFFNAFMLQIAIWSATDESLKLIL